MKEIWQSTNNFYLANSLIFTSVFVAIILTFLVQFRVEALQDEILKTQNQIITSEDEIQLLEVEWVYLTRPERLRQLASRYLQDNGYVLASQIKDSNRLEKHYLVSYKKYENSIQSKIDEQLALDDGKNIEQVSF